MHESIHKTKNTARTFDILCKKKFLQVTRRISKTIREKERVGVDLC